MTSKLTGTVLAVQANFYRVRLDREREIEGVGQEVRELLCTRRARLKKIGQQVLVGDRVEIDEPDWQGLRGAIAAIFPRRNTLDRPEVANVDRVLLVFSLADPEIEPQQLSRFLVKAEASNLQVSLCLSKQDLVSPEYAQKWCDRLQGWGYEPIALSTCTGEGISRLQKVLASGVTVVSGPSGVGKSSLINVLIPELKLRVSQVSQRLGHGRHTTRHIELFRLNDGGFLADTPGFMQPSLISTPPGLIYCFPEGREKLRVASCQFHNCLHRDEPGCIVRGGWERYEHYCAFLDEVLAHHAKIQARSKPDRSLKSMVGSGGQAQLEPRLATKRHRRSSRHSDRQELNTFYSEEL